MSDKLIAAGLLVSSLTFTTLGLQVLGQTQLVAGLFVRASLALGYWVSPWWYLFTAFVRLNLFQSAFTNWCPMITLLRKLGVKHE